MAKLFFVISRFEFIETFTLPPTTAAGAPDHIDARHLQILFALAAEIHPRAALFVGCGDGFSASLFVAMLNAGFCEDIHLITVEGRATSVEGRKSEVEGIHEALARVRIPRRTHVYGCTPDRAPVIDADFILIATNDHLDAERAFSRKPVLIAIHDTHTFPLGDATKAEAHEAGALLRLHPDYTTFQDHKTRPDEYTERGLTVGLRTDRVDNDTISFARDLMSTDQIWWKHA